MKEALQMNDHIFPLLTVGFAFNADKTKMVTILKNRPEHLAGLLCGPGGAFEADKNDRHLFDTQIREFEEETGILTTIDDWFYIGDFLNPKNKAISVFCAFNDKFLNAIQKTDEAIFIEEVTAILTKPNPSPEFFNLIHRSLDESYPKMNYQAYLNHYHLAG